jgi:hypothetical protein
MDESASWPERGHLVLDGLTYSSFAEGPVDARVRLGWLARMDRLTLQPYRQLARVLRDTGDEQGARKVLFEMEHRRRKERDHNLLSRSWSWVLRCTLGYGQMAGRALWWLLGMTILGFVISGLGYLGGAIVPSSKEAYDTFEQQGYAPSYYPQFNGLVTLPAQNVSLAE